MQENAISMIRAWISKRLIKEAAVSVAVITMPLRYSRCSSEAVEVASAVVAVASTSISDTAGSDEDKE